MISYLITEQAHGTSAGKRRKKEIKVSGMKWEQFDREGWVFNCDIGKIAAKMDLSDLYPDEEKKIRVKGNRSIYKGKDFELGTWQLWEKNPTDLAMIVHNLLTEGLVYMEAILGMAARGRILVLRKDKVYEVQCYGVQVQERDQIHGEERKCYSERPVKYKGEKKFVNRVTKIIQGDSEEVECSSNQSLFQSLKEAVNDKKLIKFSNKEVTFSLWKDRKYSRDIAKLLNKESALSLIRIEEGAAHGDMSGQMIISQIQLFLRMNAARIAIIWGVLEIVAIVAIIIAARIVKVKWWKIATILSSLAKIYKETKISCLQTRLNERAEGLEKLQWKEAQILGNDEAGSKKETYREHVHKHFDKIYIYVDNMIPRLKEYEKNKRVEAIRSKINIEAVKMNFEIMGGVERQMNIIAGRKLEIVNETKNEEGEKDDENKKNGPE